MNLLDISEQKAKELFPQEKWTKIYKNVFVAQSRKPVNSEQKKVFEKELGMAKIASDNGHVVFCCRKTHLKRTKRILIQFLTERSQISKM